MKTSRSGKSILRSLFFGCVIMLIVSILLAALTGILIHSGALPPDTMKPAAYVITAVAAMLGAGCCGRHTPRWKLPVCLLSAILYLLCALLLRSMVFGPGIPQTWGVSICAIAAAVAGAIISGMNGASTRKKFRNTLKL